MGYSDRSVTDWSDRAEANRPPWFFRAVSEFRPRLGWIVLGLCLVLSMMPAFALDAAYWTRLSRTQSVLSLCGISAVLFTWWISGWQSPVATRRFRLIERLALIAAVVVMGVLVVSLFTVRWLPAPATFLESIRSASIGPVVADMDASIQRFGARISLWWLGTIGGGAASDELIFATFAGFTLWCVSALMAALTLRLQKGLPSALPILVIVGTVVFMSGRGRMVFVFTLAAALALHVALDNLELTGRWERTRLDFNNELMLERWFAAGTVAAAALLVATVVPNVSLQSLADKYAQWVAPVDERIEVVRKQAFPNMQTAQRFSIAGTATGLPNQFLLGSGPEMQDTRILLLRTGESIGYDQIPRAPYLRASVLTQYDGLGWKRPFERAQIPLLGYTRRSEVPESGRKLLAQTVRLYRSSPVIFAAPEPVEFSVDVWLQVDAQGEMLYAGGRDASYTVLSAAPAMDEAALRGLPPWGSDPGEATLPEGFEAYLEVPPTVTQRARDLAEEITAGIESPYAKAAAIEAYLRQFPYDLEIGAPPESVKDVTDYFLFDLKRGFCDYYATAFVMLARSVGLPARFVVGYAPGEWLERERAYLVTAAESHSWPEVYLPKIGWVAFEPTASLAPLTREGDATQTVVQSVATPEPIPAAATSGNAWIALATTLAVAGLAAMLWLLARRRRLANEDPWSGFQRLGARMGHTAQVNETPLEYAAAVATLAEARGARSDDAVRVVKRDSPSMAQAVSDATYGPQAIRERGRNEAERLWVKLRAMLPLVRRR
jgi:transglutaminase-like putative cysteine protease